MRRGCAVITGEELKEYDIEIREKYIELGENLSRIPVLCNTDGERLSIHTLRYEIDSAEQAFAGLAGLCATESEAELRAMANLDDRGGIVRVEFHWNREGFKDSPVLQSTILGTVVIDGGRLEVTVNSAERAERIRKEIETRLGAGARFKNAVIQSGEAMMKAIRSRAPGSTAPASGHDELMQNPEVRAKLAEMIAAHWEGWMEQKIPALGGKTPRQAVKTSDGRESVEALLRSAERSAEADKDMGKEILKAIDGVRQRLALRGH